jgi:hypothetical protein
LIAQQEQEFQLVPAHVPQQVLVQEQVLVQAQELESVSQLAQVLESEPVQESQLALESALHLLHQPLQSLFQRQPSHLLQREFLSAFLQLAKVLQYQLCL